MDQSISEGRSDFELYFDEENASIDYDALDQWEYDDDREEPSNNWMYEGF